MTAVVTFSTITISYLRPGMRPATLLHPVRDRDADFARLASAAAVARELAGGQISIGEAETRCSSFHQPSCSALPPGM